MAVDKKQETRSLAVTTTNQLVDWGAPAITQLYVVADAANVKIDFDQPTDIGSFLLIANVPVRLTGMQFNILHASTSSGTANLYMIGVR